MDNNLEDDIFEIRVNREGVNSILRFVKNARWIFMLMILYIVILIAESVVEIYLFNPKYFIGNKLVLIQQQTYPYGSIVYCILAIIQTWYYWKTAKILSASVAEKNEKEFNHAFYLLNRHAIFALITMFIGFLMVTFQFYILLESFYHRS